MRRLFVPHFLRPSSRPPNRRVETLLCQDCSLIRSALQWRTFTRHLQAHIIQSHFIEPSSAASPPFFRRVHRFRVWSSFPNSYHVRFSWRGRWFLFLSIAASRLLVAYRGAGQKVSVSALSCCHMQDDSRSRVPARKDSPTAPRTRGD